MRERFERKCFAAMLVILLLVIPTSTVFGAGAQEETKKDGEEIILEFPSYQAEEPGFKDWWLKNIDEFEEDHPGVKVKLIPAAFEPHHQDLLTRFAAGNPPDIVHLSFRYYYRFADENWLEPLDDYQGFTEIQNNWAPVLDQVVVNEKTFSIPLLAYAYGLFYNEEMFEEAGVSVPTNTNELVKAAEKLTLDKSGDGRTDQFGLNLFVTEHSSAYMAATWMLIGNGTHWTDSNGNLQLTSDPTVKQTLNQWRTIVKSGWTPLGLDDVSARKHFMAGNAAMLVDGSWVAAMIPNADPEVRDHVEIARVPFEFIPSGPSNVIGMPKDLAPERKELAWDFIQQLCKADSQKEYTRLTGSPAPRSGAVTSEIAQESKGLGVFSDAQQNAADSILPKGYEIEFSEFSNIIVEGLMLLASTDRPIEQVLTNMEENLSEIK